MSDGKRLIFHVGTVKTGSTAIQHDLWNNRDRLLSQGIDYLQITPPRLDLPRYANADFLFHHGTDFSEIRRHIDTSPADLVVISEEGLWGRPSAILHPVFDGYEKTVIIYLRNSVDLITSWAAENAEPYNAAVVPPSDFPPNFQRGPLPIDIGVDQCRYFYDRIFRGFFIFLDQFLGEGGRLVVRPFEKEQLRGHDVVSDFLDLLGARRIDQPGEGSEQGPIIVNPSRSRKFCDVSATVWKIMHGRGEQELYDLSFVDSVHAACRSGDDRAVAATLPDELLVSISEEFGFVEKELSARSVLAGQDILREKLPSVFGKMRQSLVPIDEQEVEVLVDREINRLRAEKALAEIVLLGADRDEARAALETARTDRDEARAALETVRMDRDEAHAALEVARADRDVARAAFSLALAERDRARRYPWKYLRHALTIRLNKR